MPNDKDDQNQNQDPNLTEDDVTQTGDVSGTKGGQQSNEFEDLTDDDIVNTDNENQTEE